MGFYRHWLFPRLCHCALRDPEVAQLRRCTLAEVAGEVLEIGFGTGLNLEHYPAAVAALTAIDPNPGMRALAAGRVAAAPFPLRLEDGNAEELPFAAARFDCVVSTFTLCSVSDLPRALAEVRRVLRPGGHLVFLEHGLAAEPAVARWQRRLTPWQRRLADGCHLDRDMAAAVGTALRLRSVERSYLRAAPRVMGALYRGVAVAD